MPSGRRARQRPVLQAAPFARARRRLSVVHRGATAPSDRHSSLDVMPAAFLAYEYWTCF